jgi:MazG family protein
LARLGQLLDALLDPAQGCPWDRSQTTKSLTEDFLEEVYELRQALLEDRPADVLEEAGDVAFLLVFLARLTQSAWNFGLAQMLDAAVDKMVRRHPHVFGHTEVAEDLESFLKLWHRLKRAAKPQGGVLASVPTALPALTRCHRLAQKAGRAGFDFPHAADVRRALSLELAELDAELAVLGDLTAFDKSKGLDKALAARVEHEIGDVLASVVNLARLLGFSAEKSLDAYNRRFIGRFEAMEAALAQRGLKPEEVGPTELERLWQEAKNVEGSAAGAVLGRGVKKAQTSAKPTPKTPLKTAAKKASKTSPKA